MVPGIFHLPLVAQQPQVGDCGLGSRLGPTNHMIHDIYRCSLSMAWRTGEAGSLCRINLLKFDILGPAQCIYINYHSLFVYVVENKESVETILPDIGRSCNFAVKHLKTMKHMQPACVYGSFVIIVNLKTMIYLAATKPQPTTYSFGL